MKYQLAWRRSQNYLAAQERLARAKVLKLWQGLWAVSAALGLSSAGYLIVTHLTSLDRVFEAIKEPTLRSWLVWLGLLGFMMLARIYTSAWVQAKPLKERVARQTKKSQDLSSFFSPDVLVLIDKSFLLRATWQPLDLILVCLQTQALASFFRRLGHEPTTLFKQLQASHVPEADLTPRASQHAFRSIVFKTFESALARSDTLARPGDLLVSLATVPSSARDFLVDNEVDLAQVAGVNHWMQYQRRLSAKSGGFVLERSKHWRNQLWTSTVTPILDAIGRDLTEETSELPSLVNRREELLALYELLAGQGYGALLVGPRGAGKSRLIEGLAQQITQGLAPPIIADRRVVTISIARLLSLTGPRKPLKSLVGQLTNEIARSENIVVVIEDLLNFESAKTEEAAGLVESLLADTIKTGQVLLLATAEPDSLAKLSGPLASALPRLQIKEMNQAQTVRVLENQAPLIESLHQINLTYSALSQVSDLAAKFVHGGAQPGKSLTLLREAAEYYASQQSGQWLSDKEIRSYVADKTGLPLKQLSASDEARLLKLEDEIRRKYINQDQAVKAVASAIRRARTQVGSHERPIANFLFLGPTGVGKTELCRRLAEVYFGGQGKMIRLDMTEYQEAQALRNLIGAPAGTGGASEGHLLKAARENPFAVILLDEFEKAHPDIFNIFLQVMEDGRLTSPSGETYDFTNTMLIATSNAGSQMIQDGLKAKQAMATIVDRVKSQALPQFFKPELLNRFDSIILFEPLRFQHVVAVAKLLVNELIERLAAREIKLEATPEALQDLSKLGFDSTLGARPLRRALQDHIEDEIAKLLLAKEIRARDSVIIKKDLKLEIKKAEHFTPH